MSGISALLIKSKTLAASLARIFKKTDNRADEKEPPQNGGVRTADMLCAVFEKAARFLREKLPGKKERLVCAVFSGVFAALLFGVVILLARRPAASDEAVTRNSRAGSSARDGSRDENGFTPNVIPPGDIFLPDEPDFVPGIMLERERRTIWTNDNTKPFWRDPLRNGEEHWRRLLETEVDILMERVP